MELTAAERSALELAVQALEEAAASCEADSPIRIMLIRRARRWREDLLDA